MTIAKKLTGGLPFVLQITDFLSDGECDPRQFRRTHARSIGKVLDMLVKLIDTLFFGELLEEE
jgi:hypothetical protein